MLRRSPEVLGSSEEGKERRMKEREREKKRKREKEKGRGREGEREKEKESFGCSGFRKTKPEFIAFDRFKDEISIF